MKFLFQKNPSCQEPVVTIEACEQTQEVLDFYQYAMAYEKNKGRYLVKSEGQIYKILHREIKKIEVFGDYATLYSTQQTLTFRKSLRQIEQELPAKNFVRVSRNTLLNITAVIKIESSFSGTMVAILSDVMHVNISRKYWKEVKQRILNDE
ncbi:MAG: LytR/AlgR family response regulator transcription factor [Enterococcus sp.]